MARERHLSRAPIVEAVFDVKVKMQAGFEVQTLLEAQGELAPEYPQKEDMSQFEFGVQQAVGKAPEQHFKDLGILGYRFTTADKRQIVQFRLDGFTFSRLAPYTQWEFVLEEASRLWKIFERTARLEEALRIAVRYINRLPFPKNKIEDFSPFLTAPPPLPKELNLFVNHFVSRVTVSDPNSQLVANMIQAVQPDPSDNLVPVILDIDVFETGPFAPRADVITPRFPALRIFKNKLFFSSLTEDAVTLFE